MVEQFENGAQKAGQDEARTSLAQEAFSAGAAESQEGQRTEVEQKTLPGGTKYTKFSDDSERFAYTDGTAYERHADREVHFNKNGDAIEKYNNGTLKVVYKNGNTVTRTTDGDVQLEQSDGKSFLWKTDGTTHQFEGNDATTWSADGSVTRIFEDGSEIAWDKNGEITVSLNDNLESTFHADGSITHLRTESVDDTNNGKPYTLGTSFNVVKEMPNGDVEIALGFEGTDGSIQQSDNIVLRRSFDPDGTLVMRSDDNAIEVRRSPDGTVTQLLRDGDTTVVSKFLPSGEYQYGEGNLSIQRFRDGTVEVSNLPDVDAQNIRVMPSGDATFVLKDGTQRTIERSGRITTVKPDGTHVLSRIQMETSDGVTVYPDFRRDEPTVALPDGTNATIEMDGDRFILVKADGTKSFLLVDEENSRLFEEVTAAKVVAFESRERGLPKSVEVFRGKTK